MAKYSNTSPYFETSEIADYLDILNPRTLTAEQDDQSYTIERTYAYRPDLLAYDLYGSPRLWWVFAQRNPDQIEDPIYDFKPGVTVQLPKKENLLNSSNTSTFCEIDGKVQHGDHCYDPNDKVSLQDRISDENKDIE